MSDLSMILTPEYVSVILLPALIAGIAVSLCSSLLGVSLVLKRCSMIGDGLSHVGYGTLCIAVALGWAPMQVTIPQQARQMLPLQHMQRQLKSSVQQAALLQ